MRLRVISKDNIPDDCRRYVELTAEYDMYHEWIRNECECVFRLWSEFRDIPCDTRWDSYSKKRVDVDSPLVPILDEDGDETGEYELRSGIIAFPLDMYEHSGRVWALSGEGGAGFYCPWDSTREIAYLYVDRERWEAYMGKGTWTVKKDGTPTAELRKRAIEIARSEVDEMNLCERASYYGYTEYGKIDVRGTVEETDWRGCKSVKPVEDVRWKVLDSCGECLTDDPARDVEFPIGCPVVTDCTHMVGDVFEQECWALFDKESNKYLASQDVYTDDPALALLWRMESPEMRESFEADTGKKLEFVDVTKLIWDKYPECHG